MEEKLENQNKNIINHESKVQNMEEQMNKLENEKLLLLDELELLRKTIDTRKSINQNLEFKNDVRH